MKSPSVLKAEILAEDRTFEYTNRRAPRVIGSNEAVQVMMLNSENEDRDSNLGARSSTSTLDIGIESSPDVEMMLDSQVLDSFMNYLGASKF